MLLFNEPLFAVPLNANLDMITISGGVLASGDIVVNAIYLDNSLGGILGSGIASINVISDRLNFIYSVSGGINIIGCAIYIFKNSPHSLFSVGDIVYSLFDALHKGKLNAIYIKKLLYPFCDTRFPPLYIDKDNGVWNENELVSYSQALVLVQEYQVNQYTEDLGKIQNC